MEPLDPQFSPSEAYHAVDAKLSALTDPELCALVGAVTAEFVNRGNDHETALEFVQGAANGGITGSKLFDMVEE